MNDSLLMRVLYCIADLGEEAQPIIDREGMSVAIIGDPHTFDQFHYKIRSPTLGGPGIEYVSDVRMAHQRERLPFRLEARDHAFCIHPRLDDLQCDAS